jgi:hypothetical protein
MIIFGDATSNKVGTIDFDHSGNVMEFEVGASSDVHLRMIDGTGSVFNEGGVSTLDFRVEGGTNANLFFCDAGLDAVGIGTTAVSGSILTLATTTSNLEFVASTYNAALTTPPTTTNGYLTVEIGGNVCYIPAYTAAPS